MNTNYLKECIQIQLKNSESIAYQIEKSMIALDNYKNNISKNEKMKKLKTGKKLSRFDLPFIEICSIKKIKLNSSHLK